MNRLSLDSARDLTHSTPAQGHPEPACGEPVEPVERMSLSNGRADGRFQIHSLALVATNQMLFPRRARRMQRAGHPIHLTEGNEVNGDRQE